MSTRHWLARACKVGPALLFPLALLYACNKPAGSGSGASSSSTVGGAALFTSNCSKCHTINGSGSKRAPDLSHVGADASHTAAWLAEFVKNPGKIEPGSRMPPFEGKISDSDLKSLTEYLASLK